MRGPVVLSASLLTSIAGCSLGGLTGGDTTTDAGAPNDANAARDVTVAIDAGTDANAADAGIDSGCNDTTSDTHNCGRCGHDCLGGACANGVCAPVTIFTNDEDGGTLWGIAVDGTHVFYTNNHTGPDAGSTVDRLDYSGANKIALAQPGSATGIAVDSDVVYYATQNNEELHSASLDLTNTQVINGSNVLVDTCITIAPDDHSLFFSSLTHIWQFPFGASSTNAIGSGASQPYGVASNGAMVFWSNHSTTTAPTQGSTDLGDSIYTQPFDGGPAVPYVTGESNPGCIAFEGNVLYWTDQGAGSIRLKDTSVDGGVTNLVAGEGQPVGLAIDGASFWWTNGTTIRRLAK